MKKIYRKPEIFIENFEVSEFIAGNCSIDLGFAGNNPTCDPYDFGGINLFNHKGCDINPEDMDLGDNDELCYHEPLANNRIFGS